MKSSTTEWIWLVGVSVVCWTFVIICGAIGDAF